MTPTFRIAPTEEVPRGADVGHVDELESPARERLPVVANGSETTTDDPAFASTADRFDLVKFTDYYRVERV